MSLKEQAVLLYIKYNDNVTIDDLSEELQAKKLDLYPMLKELCEGGKVRKIHQYYHLRGDVV